MEFKLIIKKLNGTLTKDETKIFNTWINESQEHRAFFEKVNENYKKGQRDIDIDIEISI
jgi:hypothetical protein